MTEGRFVRFLRTSLQLVAQEAPALAGQLAAALTPLEVAVDDEACLVSVFDGTVVVRPPGPPAPVQVATQAATVRALLRGETTLLDAVLGDHLALIGTVDAIAAFDRALFLYLNATVRSPGHPELLRRYLSPEET